MTKYLRLPPLYEIHQYRNPNIDAFRAWAENFDPAELARVGVDRLEVVIGREYDDEEGNHVIMDVKILSYQGDSVVNSMDYIQDGDLVVWEMLVSDRFMKWPASELALLELAPLNVDPLLGR